MQHQQPQHAAEQLKTLGPQTWFVSQKLCSVLRTSAAALSCRQLLDCFAIRRLKQLDPVLFFHPCLSSPYPMNSPAMSTRSGRDEKKLSLHSVLVWINSESSVTPFSAPHPQLLTNNPDSTLPLSSSERPPQCLTDQAAKLSHRHTTDLHRRIASIQRAHVAMSHDLLRVSRVVDALESRLAAVNG